jgi:hypothetical protein
MRISKNNKRDIYFYLKNRNEFCFSGTLSPDFTPIYSKSGVNGLTAFISIDSQGKNIPTKHPRLLESLLLTKASVNFQIKQWAQGRADGTLPLSEFSKKYLFENATSPIIEFEREAILSVKTLAWVNKEPVYFNDIQEQYNLPDWVVKAVENQKKHFYE